jgi:uncharacterized protein YjbI with pentapeptide repeats
MKEIDFTSWTPGSQPKFVELNDGIREKTTVSDARFSHCLLKDKYLRDVTFKGGMIRHCRLEFCNLRNASFERIDFTGTVFLNCDLRRANFSSCTLWYTSFDRCTLNYDAILPSAPPETNLRQQFFRTLRLNAVSLGDKVWADRMLHLELIAERDELKNIIFGSTEYYRTRYNKVDQLSSVLRFALHFVNDRLWGHGINVKRLLLSGLLFVGIFAVICWISPAQYAVRNELTTRGLNAFEAAYYSVISFTTGGFGDIVPGNTVARVITAIEGLLGLVFLGFFTAAIYRRYSR